MFSKEFFVDAWFVIEAFEVSLRDELDEVLISLFIFAENDEVMGTPARRIPIEPIRFRHVHLAADDRLHPGLVRRFIKSNRAEKVSMIGNGHRRHFVLRGGFRESVVIARAIEQTEAGMQVK